MLVARLVWLVDDLPPGQSLQTLAAELEHWQLLLQELSPDELPSTTQEALRFAADKLCPCITRLLELVCSLPVSTASCERCISGLRRLKTYLRTTMGQERLSRLALLPHTHYVTSVDVEQVIKVFMRKNPRRIIMPDTFTS